MDSNLITNDIKEIIKNIYLCTFYYVNFWYVSLQDEYLEKLIPKFEEIFKDYGLDIGIFTKNAITKKYDTYKEVLFELFISDIVYEDEELIRTKYGFYDKEYNLFTMDILKNEIVEEVENIKDEYQFLIKMCAWFICDSFNVFEGYELLFGENNNDEEVKLLEKSNN